MNMFALPGKRVFIGFLLVLNVFLGYRLFISDQGMLAYRALKQKHDDLVGRLEYVQEHSKQLSREILRLKSDRGYVESVIRSRMNYVGRDEVLYVLPKAYEQQSTADGAGAGQDEDKN